MYVKVEKIAVGIAIQIYFIKTHIYNAPSNEEEL